MTAEIVIMNCEAIAIAADSAVSSGPEGSEKIFTSGNKIFSLSDYSPVGIMIYNNSSFVRLPWETIIKMYRKQLEKKSFSTLEEYGNNFIKFLHSLNKYIPMEDRIAYFNNKIESYFLFMFGGINFVLSQARDQKGDNLSKEEENEIISNIINEESSSWEKTKFDSNLTEKDISKIKKKFKKIINDTIKDCFYFIEDESTINKLEKIGLYQIIKFPNPETKYSPSYTGLVITGFGKNEVYPSLKSYIIEGIYPNNKVRFNEDKLIKIGPGYNKSGIMPFAEKLDVYAFLRGIHPTYETTVLVHIKSLLENVPSYILDNIKELNIEQKNEYKSKFKKYFDEEFKEYSEKLFEYGTNKFVNPVREVLSILPKDEMAKMAETFVNLTSFRQRITMSSETVGGPIDVAVISKGDGFIWIKRKYYFDKELNPKFFNRNIEGDIDEIPKRIPKLSRK